MINIFLSTSVLIMIYAPITRMIGSFSNLNNQFSRFFSNNVAFILNSKIKEIEDAKSGFISRITEELRTPLISIISMCDEQKNLSITCNKTAEIHDSAYKLLSVVDQIIDCAKADSGTLILNTSTIDIRLLVNRVVLSFDSLFADKNISFSMNCNSDDMFVHVDPKKMSDVFTHLISNAVTFNRNGGIVEIDILKHDQAIIEVLIRDNGVGMEQSRINEVFEFLHVSGINTSKSGIRIGLCFSKKIIEKHGGSISIRGELGFGTEVSVKMPSDCCVNS